MKNLKISIIGTTTFPCPPTAYGGEIFIYNLAYALHQRGNEVILYGVKNDSVDYPFKLNQLRNTYGEARWDVEFEAFKYYQKDLLDSDVVLDMSHGKITAQYLYEFKLKSEVCNYLIGNFFARPTPPFNIIVNSEKQLELGIKGRSGFEGTQFEHENFPSGRIPETSKYIHLGTDTDFYHFNEDKDDYFLWCARFHPSKGADIAIQLAKDTGINLVLIGDIDSHPLHQYWGNQYLQMIQGYPNIKYIALPKDERHQAMKRDLMAHAKAFLNPIKFHESFGLTVIENLSCGTPVITSNMGAMPEIIKHGETGFLCDSYEKMKMYVKEIDELSPKKCREDVEKRFSREVMAKNYEKVLEGLKNGVSW